MYANVLFPINAGPFTYIVPDELRTEISRGCRVQAPFKKGHKVGIVVSLDKELRISNAAAEKHNASSKKEIRLKSIKSVLDQEPFIPEKLISLIKWVGQYYMSTTGLALKNAVPAGFFSGKKAGKPRIVYDEVTEKEKNIKLSSEQQKALDEITIAEKGVFLLHGVTGSGKTEIYINSIKSLPDEKTAIVLVPEIALTVQMISRFRSAFGDRAVFFHSDLSAGERLTLWQKIRNGNVKVVIGVRSAVYSPFENLGIIIVDEEQEASYKQFEGLRYSARDVALARAQIEGIKVILGSATPSMEAFYSAASGKFTYLELKHRVDRKPMPHVEIIDMTKEDKQTFSISVKLLLAMKENISGGYQSLIMLNRRGYSPFYMCTDCGHTSKCPACSITLIYHKDTNTLNCHYCGSYLKPGPVCPDCGGTRIKYLGAGTQRIEEELHSLLPEMSFKRMDRDTTRIKLSHHRIIRQMEDKKLDMLLGTQMVAKGHDFPDVTLSAVVSSDIALNLPDFRSAERSFQLFTQLAGRAGRGDVSGKALIQTYEPDHYVFDYVRNHDYKGFYEKEIEFRKELSYPPFSKLIRIVISFRTKDMAQKNIKGISDRIKKIPSATSNRNKTGIEILGPAPAPIEKIRNLWRWHIVLKGRDSKALRNTASLIIDKIRDMKEVRIDIDVDPVNLL